MTAENVSRFVYKVRGAPTSFAVQRRPPTYIPLRLHQTFAILDKNPTMEDVKAAVDKALDSLDASLRELNHEVNHPGYIGGDC